VTRDVRRLDDSESELTDDEVLKRLFRTTPAIISVSDVTLNLADRSESIEIRLSVIRRLDGGCNPASDSNDERLNRETRRR